MRKGTLYFARGKSGGNLVKIGFSTNVERRLADLALDFGGELEIIGTVPCTLLQEQQLHRVLKFCSVGNEWYRHTKRLMEFIELTLRCGVRTAISEQMNRNLLHDYKASTGDPWEKKRQRLARQARKQAGSAANYPD